MLDKHGRLARRSASEFSIVRAYVGSSLAFKLMQSGSNIARAAAECGRKAATKACRSSTYCGEIKMFVTLLLPTARSPSNLPVISRLRCNWLDIVAQPVGLNILAMERGHREPIPYSSPVPA